MHGLEMAKTSNGADTFLVDGLIDQALGRIDGGTIDFKKLPGIVRVSTELGGVAKKHGELLRAAAEMFQNLEHYDSLDKVEALADFLSIDATPVDDALFERVRDIVESEWESLFEDRVLSADDEEDLGAIETTADDLEHTFGVSLESLRFWIDERYSTLSERVAERHEKERPARPENRSQASDMEVMEIFGSLFA